MFPFRLIDLTHSLSSAIPTWDGNCGFELSTVIDYQQCATDVKFRVQGLRQNAGSGTHIDAPKHCFSGQAAVDELLLNDLCAPCVVIDVSLKAHESYSVSVQDLRDFELKYSTVFFGCFVIIRTGWDRFWNEPKRYRNELKFPSISAEAVRYLLEKDIVGLGIDTLSPDRPQDGFAVHKLMLGAGKYIVENVANAQAMPFHGAFCMALPMKVEHGTEAPIRLIGLTSK